MLRYGAQIIDVFHLSLANCQQTLADLLPEVFCSLVDALWNQEDPFFSRIEEQGYLCDGNPLPPTRAYFGALLIAALRELGEEFSVDLLPEIIRHLRYVTIRMMGRVALAQYMQSKVRDGEFDGRVDLIPPTCEEVCKEAVEGYYTPQLLLDLRALPAEVSQKMFQILLYSEDKRRLESDEEFVFVRGLPLEDRYLKSEKTEYLVRHTINTYAKGTAFTATVIPDGKQYRMRGGLGGWYAQQLLFLGYGNRLIPEEAAQ